MNCASPALLTVTVRESAKPGTTEARYLRRLWVALAIVFAAIALVQPANISSAIAVRVKAECVLLGTAVVRDVAV